MSESKAGDKTVKLVIRDIEQNKLKGKLTTKDIMTKYSVGMTIAREVLYKLVSLKELIYKQNSGFMIFAYNPVKTLKSLNQLKKFSAILVDDIFDNYCIKWASNLGQHPTFLKLLINNINVKNITADEINQLDKTTQRFFMDSISNTGEENIEIYKYIIQTNITTLSARNVAIFMDKPELIKDFYTAKLNHMEQTHAAILNQDKKEVLKVYLEAIKFTVRWHVQNS